MGAGGISSSLLWVGAAEVDGVGVGEEGRAIFTGVGEAEWRVEVDDDSGGNPSADEVGNVIFHLYTS